MRGLFSFLLTFLVGAAFAQNGCVLPTIESTSGGGIYCKGDKVTLSVEGTLGDATEWKWYLGVCGQNSLPAATGNSITIEVNASASYFVRGIGGCVPAGGTCQEIAIILDDQPPDPFCSDDIMVMAAAGETAVPVDYPIPGATDNCPGGVKIELIEGVQSGGLFDLGVTTVTYQFTDARNNTSFCTFNVIVQESGDPDVPTGPMITCPDDLEAATESGKCGATVVYDLPKVAEGVKVELTKGLGSGAFFPVGTTVETYTATDAAGNTMTCSFRITVNQPPEDVRPPSIHLSKKRIKIWPPNHKLVNIDVSDYISSVSGNCSITKDHVVITKVTSDEPANGTGDGNTPVDIIISDDCGSVDLRAERSGNGNGRIYTIYLAVVDENGNKDQEKIIAYVPHDNGNRKKNNQDDDDERKGGKKSGRSDRSQSVVNDGTKYTVTGCEPVAPPPPAAPPVYYTYESKEEVRFTSSINPFPNPFRSALNVRYTATANDEVTIGLFDLRGAMSRVLFQGSLNARQTYNWHFELSDVDPKIYLLVIKGRNTYVTRKVIKL
jgi:hypothetical protein